VAALYVLMLNICFQSNQTRDVIKLAEYHIKNLTIYISLSICHTFVLTLRHPGNSLCDLLDEVS